MDKLKKLLKRKKVMAGVVLIVVGLVFLATRLFSKSSEASYQTKTVEKGSIVSSVSGSGRVLSVNIMSANTKASGIVKNVYVSDGDQVKKGDKILQIDLDFQGEQKYLQAWSSYLSAKNSLESARTSLYTLQSQAFAANQKLINDAVARELETSDPTYIQENADWLAAEAKYKSQQQVISAAQTSLTSAWLNSQQASPVITAPTDGTITSLMYVEGMSIGSLDTGNSESNQKVATIKTEGLPVLSVNLSEVDVFNVLLGQKAIITIDSVSGKTFSGEVAGVDRIGITSNGVTQYEAIIKLSLAAEQILPNMAVTANIIIDHNDEALLVPSSAVKTQNDQSYVQVLKDNQPEYVFVETGLTSDTQTEIVSGLSEGDEVITGTISASGQSETSQFGSSEMGGMMRMVR